jgi:mannose-6-phosphate isomerase-like protein (cupin superfamily)
MNQNNKTNRPWGYYQVLHTFGKEVKLKELTVEPGKRLSMQRHAKRSEFWFVVEGIASLYTVNISTDLELVDKFGKFESIWINSNDWHQLANEGEDTLRIVEIQFGEECEEEDIERAG